MPSVLTKIGWLTFGGAYQPGDQPPTAYCDWQEWAGVQRKAGLRQARCGKCGLFQFPQELSRQRQTSTPVCNQCAGTVAVEL